MRGGLEPRGFPRSDLISLRSTYPLSLPSLAGSGSKLGVRVSKQANNQAIQERVCHWAVLVLVLVA